MYRRLNPGTDLPADFHQVELFFECSLLADPRQPGSAPDPGQTGTVWLGLAELLQRRFFPKPLLARLQDATATYLGVC